MPIKPSPSVSRAITRKRATLNEQLACALEGGGCDRRRHALGRHCRQHQRRRERWGHPLGCRVPAVALKRHLRWWREFIGLNPESPQLKRAVAHIARLLRGDLPATALTISWRIPRPPRGIKAHLRRLHEGGLGGAEALAMVGALNRLAYSEHPLDVGALPDDDRLSVAMGRAVVLSRPLPKRRDPRTPSGYAKDKSVEPPGSICLALGRHLRGQLAGLFAWVTLEERKSKDKKTREASAA